MFDFFKKKTDVNENVEKIFAPVAGEAVASSEVSDPTFGEEMLGKGMAVRPTDTKVYAPFDGRVDMMFDTKHAVSLVSDKGAEVLIHVGLDTVTLEGKPFTAHVESGAQMKKGDLLLEFDMDAITTAGLDTIIPIVICNTDDYKEVKPVTGRAITTDDVIMELVK